jgi:hypothetical protein
MSPKEITDELNLMLLSENPSRKRFLELTEELAAVHRIMPLLIDLKYFSERRLRQLKSMKLKMVKVQDFENAASYRDLEKECQTYLDMKSEYNITASSFVIDEDFITCIYLGSSRNEEKIFRWFNKFMEKHPFDPWTYKANIHSADNADPPVIAE